MDVPIHKIKIQGASEEKAQEFIQSLLYRQAKISFTTQEDVDRKTNGDYFLYFK